MDDGFAELSQFTLDPASVRLLPRPWCLQHDVVVLGVVDPKSTEAITVAMLDPSEPGLIDTVTRTLRRPIRPVRLNRYEIRRALDAGMPGPADDDFIGPGGPEADFFAGRHRLTPRRESLTYAEGSKELVQHTLIVDAEIGRAHV